VLGFKVGKNANMTPQIFFSQHFDMCIKKRMLISNPLEKVKKKFMQKQLLA
jgi:hypothetical protein